MSACYKWCIYSFNYTHFWQLSCLTTWTTGDDVWKTLGRQVYIAMVSISLISLLVVSCWRALKINSGRPCRDSNFWWSFAVAFWNELKRKVKLDKRLRCSTSVSWMVQQRYSQFTLVVVQFMYCSYLSMTDVLRLNVWYVRTVQIKIHNSCGFSEMCEYFMPHFAALCTVYKSSRASCCVHLLQTSRTNLATEQTMICESTTNLNVVEIIDNDTEFYCTLAAE